MLELGGWIRVDRQSDVKAYSRPPGLLPTQPFLLQVEAPLQSEAPQQKETQGADRQRLNHRLEARLLLERLHQPVGPGGEVEGSGRGDHQIILPQPPASAQSPTELRIGLGRLMEAAGVDQHIGICRQSGVLPQQAHTGVVVHDREARAAHGPTAELLPALRAVASVAAGFDFIHQAETGAARQGGEQPNHGQGILAGTGEAVEVPPPAAE